MAGWAAAAPAQQLHEMDYAALAAEVTGRVDFDGALPPRPEPGYRLDHGLAFAGGHLGTHFTGQRSLAWPVAGGELHDRLEQTSLPHAPLTLETGPPGEGLSLALHRAFGSMGLMPVGPAGFPDRAARGEGSVAILFAEDVCMAGFLAHTEFADDLGSNAGHRGTIRIAAYTRDGRRIGQITRHPGVGISGHGVRVPDGDPGFAGLTIENEDPGGISLDDIVFGGCVQVIG